MARVNEVLREVLADAMERAAAQDSRLELATITAVECEPDLRHATVFMASLSDEAAQALSEARPRLQGAIAREVRIKRTPLLSFEPDPAVAYGEKIEAVLRGLRNRGELGHDETTSGSGMAGLGMAGPEISGSDSYGPEPSGESTGAPEHQPSPVDRPEGSE